MASPPSTVCPCALLSIQDLQQAVCHTVELSDMNESHCSLRIHCSSAYKVCLAKLYRILHGFVYSVSCGAVHASNVWRESNMLDHRFLPTQRGCSLLYLAPEVVQGLPCDEKLRSPLGLACHCQSTPKQRTCPQTLCLVPITEGCAELTGKYGPINADLEQWDVYCSAVC